MSAVNFSEWAIPALKLKLGGATYEVAPPDVERAKLILALTVRTEVGLGLAAGPMPEELDDVLASEEAMQPLGVITLGKGAYDAMLADRVPTATIERMAYYAMLYWARGKDRADAVAQALWTPKDDDTDSGDASEK
jgi:hypothetical protein